MDRVIFPHSEGWKIFVHFVLQHLLDNAPQHSIRFIEKGMLQYPNEVTFAQVALYLAESSDMDNEVIAMLQRVESQVEYDVMPYIEVIQNPLGD